MASVTECRLALAAPPFVRAARRVGNVSLPDFESLRSSEDFRRVLSKGTRRRQGAIVMVTSPGRPGPPRLGLVVSRNSGNAVTRNRIKRRLRHAVAGMPLQPGTDYVIIANSQVAEVSYSRLQDWLGRALVESADA